MADQAEKEVCAKDRLLGAQRLPAGPRQAAIAKLVEDCQVSAALCSSFSVCAFLPSFLPSIYSFIHSFIHSFIRRLMHSRMHARPHLGLHESCAVTHPSFFLALCPPFVHPFICSVIHYSVLHSPVTRLNQLFSSSFTCHSTQSTILFFVHLSLDSLIHSLDTCLPLGLGA